MKKYDSLRNIFSIISTVFLIISLALIVCLMIIQSKKLAPSFLGISCVYVLSDSMQPDFNKGDAVIIKKTSEENLQIGDIVAFYKNNKTNSLSNIYLHRISDIKFDENDNRIFQTKGDANFLPDLNWIHYDMIIGAYSSKYKLLPNFLSFAISKTGIICMVILPCGLIFMIEFMVFINLIDERKKNKKQKTKISAETIQIAQENEEALNIEHISISYDISEAAHGLAEGNGFIKEKQALPPDKKIVILPIEKKSYKKELSDLLLEIDDFKKRPRVTGRMIMKTAILLEKFKKSYKYKNDGENQLKIREALNWCYFMLGKIQYKPKIKNN